MENIPGDMLAETLRLSEPGAVLRAVAEHHKVRADKLRAVRTRGWKSASDELDGVAGHLEQYATALADHFALYGDDTPMPAESPTFNGTDLQVPPGKVTPAPLPNNTGRCASFRRANPDDEAVCTLERGHAGDHAGSATGTPDFTWPRTHSGAVCGDVVILPDGTALNCARPLGHDGDEHYDGRYRLWPRGAGTSRQTRVCTPCNTDTHRCPGCGVPLDHFTALCEVCKAEANRETPVAEPITAAMSALLDYDNMCGDQQDDAQPASTDVCMLPAGHTGKHIGRTGARWEQLAAEPVTLAEQTEQARAAMAPSIPEQRQPDDTPAAALVAETKQEVAATVAELTGDEPIGTVVNVGGIEFVKHSNNPFGDSALTNPFAAEIALPADGGLAVAVGLGNPFAVMPPAPPAPRITVPLLPPHLVPGSPKPHQSVSSIQMMSECGLRYRLKYRDGIRDDFPAWWNVGGTSFHRTVEHIERVHAESGGNLYSITDPVFQTEREAADIWRDIFASQVAKVESDTDVRPSSWRAAKGGKESESWWRASGEDMVRRYVHHRVEFLKGWSLLTTPGGGFAQEVEFNAAIDGVQMKGFIDSAWISTDGTTIRVEDYKSGSSAGDPFQLKTYGAALRAMGAAGSGDDQRRIVGTFYEARKGAPTAPLELTAADDTEVSYRANTTAAMDAAGIFPANPSPANCATCSVSHACPVMAMKS